MGIDDRDKIAIWHSLVANRLCIPKGRDFLIYVWDNKKDFVMWDLLSNVLLSLNDQAFILSAMHHKQ